MKRDANEKAIVETLRKCGFLVQQIDQGGGVPDLLVCAGGRVVLLEVKDGPKKKLTPAQQKWHAQWEGAPVFVVDSIESALAAVQDIDPQATANGHKEWCKQARTALRDSHDLLTSSK